ncbi:MAG TPA: methylmalonyl-CoA mutase family protein [Candidatus Sulfopaludibacter sp.]|jgi:methylmalonyl-CoA mutase|nr:methylmalonyl-CoA mutase family protein [Candidatus Sulfopaludibacter sp.]
MSEDAAVAEILHLGADFPPVATAEWEAAIQKDLKGADYEKKLVWRTDEGIPVRPYYRRENLAGLGAQLEAAPGRYPYVRGNGRPWETRQEPYLRPTSIRADYLHESGAHAVQEIAYAVAEGVERLNTLALTVGVDLAASHVDFVFAVGSNYFFEIAKLRAARMVWAQAVAAFHPEDAGCCSMHLHVRTSRLNKSVCDRYTNLLRVTTESMSAVIGGCDSLSVEPFGFSPQLALGVQRVLREEAHLDAVADPAGGSYYIEALTDTLARDGWRLFQAVEAEGGYARAVASGSIEKALAATRAARKKAVSSRRRTLVGVNNYPNLAEKTPETEALVSPDSDTFPAFRLAEPFEQIRARSARHAARTGRYPKVLLLKRGDLKMRMARANFSLNFLGCAGFDVVEAEQYQAAAADLIVLCSSDAEYLALAQEVCANISVPVLVAGNPKEQIEALQSAGVQGFIHIQSDAVQTLSEWQTRLGMEA